MSWGNDSSFQRAINVSQVSYKRGIEGDFTTWKKADVLFQRSRGAELGGVCPGAKKCQEPLEMESAMNRLSNGTFFRCQS